MGTQLFFGGQMLPKRTPPLLLEARWQAFAVPYPRVIGANRRWKPERRLERLILRRLNIVIKPFFKLPIKPSLNHRMEILTELSV